MSFTVNEYFGQALFHRTLQYATTIMITTNNNNNNSNRKKREGNKTQERQVMRNTIAPHPLTPKH